MKFNLTPQQAAKEVAYIIRNSTDKWNQSLWIKFPGSSGYWNESISIEELRLPHNACGTTGCVAGWIVLLTAKKSAVYRPGQDKITWKDESMDVRSFAKEALNLTDVQAEWLFDGARTKDQVLTALDKIAAGDDSPWGYLVMVWDYNNEHYEDKEI